MSIMPDAGTYTDEIYYLIIVYVTFLCDAARQKLLKSANVLRSYLKNESGLVFKTQCISSHNNYAVCAQIIGYKLTLQRKLLSKYR